MGVFKLLLLGPMFALNSLLTLSFVVAMAIVFAAGNFI